MIQWSKSERGLTDDPSPLMIERRFHPICRQAFWVGAVLFFCLVYGEEFLLMRTTSAITSTMRLRTWIMQESFMLFPPYSVFGNCDALGGSSVRATQAFFRTWIGDCILADEVKKSNTKSTKRWLKNGTKIVIFSALTFENESNKIW